MTSKWRRPQKWRQPQNEGNLKNEDHLKNEDKLKKENDLKKEDNHKNKDDLKKRQQRRAGEWGVVEKKKEHSQFQFRNFENPGVGISIFRNVWIIKSSQTPS